MDKVLRSKGSAKQPTKISIIGASVKRCNFEELLGPLLPTAIQTESESFIEGLSINCSLKEQTCYIQQYKGYFLKRMSNTPCPNDVILEIKILVKLYLHPDYALLRKSTEWIIEAVGTNQTIDSAVLRRALCDVSLQLIEYAETAGVLLDSNIEIATAWALTFTCIAMFDKEYCFFDQNENFSVDSLTCISKYAGGIMELDDTSPLLQFLSILDKMFAKFSKIVSADDANSSAEVMRYAECCGECMRAIMTALKSRRGVYVGEKRSDKWMLLIDTVITNGCAILRSDLVHKDTVTATAMSLICLQWISRYRLAGKGAFPITPSTQLVAILDLLNLASGSEGEQTASPIMSGRHTVLESGVHAVLFQNLPTLPIISRCALLRASLTVFDEIALSSDSGTPGSPSILLGPLFAAVVAVCSHSLPLVRLYGLQTLESWFNCLDIIISPAAQAAATVPELWMTSLMPNMRAISALLISTWSHPSKQVNHMVPTVYQRLINAVHSLTAGVKSASREQEVTAVWKSFIIEALALPAQHRARYQAMSMLIPCVGGKQIILAQPDVFEALVQAVRLRDVASSSCNVVVALLKDFTQVFPPSDPLTLPSTPTADLMAPFRPLWARSVARVVCSVDHKTRTNSADYLVPELLKVDPTSGPHLMREIRNVYPLATSSVGGTYGAMLWGLVQVTLHARSLTLPGKDIIAESDRATGDDSNAELTDQEVVWACLSDDVDLRLASLTLLTASQRTSAPMVDSELSILRKTLKYSLKTTAADQRQRLMRIVKAIVVRLAETSRISERDIQRLEKRAAALNRDLAVAEANKESEKVQEMRGKLVQGDVDILQGRAAMRGAAEVLGWLCSELFDNIYPGTVFEREVTALELLHCAVDSAGDVALKGIFFSSSMTTTLLNLLLSSWDKSRRLAADLLFKFPRPLPCYTTSAALIPLVNRGCKLAGSARQRESDAGALLLRSLFTIYSMSLGWHCGTVRHPPSTALLLSYSVAEGTAAPEVNGSSAPSRGEVSSACVSFLSSLCDLLGDRLGNLEGLFTAFTDADTSSDPIEVPGTGPEVGSVKAVIMKAETEGEKEPAPLCHGLLLAIRYCVKELHTSGLLTAPPKGSASTTAASAGSVWQPVVSRVLSLSLDALRVALLVVAEAPCDVQFAPAPTAKMRGEYSLPPGPTTETNDIVVKGPVNTSTILTASYINTNSLMGATSGAGTEGGEGDGDRENTMQRAVVAAWLLVKEAAAMLALLVEISPPPSAVTASSELLSVRDVSIVGAVILDALGRLKHMGAIAETHAALQAIAERLFKHGERSVELCRLPSLWLRQLLDRLGSEQQVFILRRSAGFAYSFVSLLRSEPSNCKVTLLPLAMRVLLKHIERGLDDVPLIAGKRDEAVDALVPSEKEAGSWRISVHALNVIRMILVDAALSPDLDAFIAESTELAVRGFQSRNWAVRNSSMMVFSSVVQRAVDNDKNESGGARAATAAEFFQRFPSLFLFLLTELGNITGHTIVCKDSWPDSVQGGVNAEAMSAIGSERVKSRGSHEGGLHPSLYPILLLLSKMRPAAEESQAAEGGARQADISLFVELVESCRGQNNQKVREMAAKALCALIPLRVVPLKAASLLRDVTESIGRSSGTPTAHNALHGSLSLCYEILDSLRRRMAGVGDNKAFMTLLQEEISSGLLPQVAEMLHILSTFSCPSLHIVLLRIARTASTLLSTYEEKPAQNIAQCLLLGQCRVALRTVLGGEVEATTLPYAPVLYREAVLDLTFYSVQHCAAGSPAQEEAQCEDPFATYPVHLLLSHLSHPISEVREGVLLGFVKALAQASPSSSGAVDPLCAYVLHRTALLEHLIIRMAQETEPPLRHLTLQLLCSLTRSSPLSRLSMRTQEAFRAQWQLLHVIATNDSITLEALQVAAKQSAAVGVVETEGEEGEDEPLLASTESAAQALEVMGWIVAASLEDQTSNTVVTGIARVMGVGWVHLLEEGACEDRSAAAREATARSLAASQLLPWAHNLAVTRQQDGSSTRSTSAAKEGWAILAIRVWIVAVKLMQDDDEEIRGTIRTAVAAVSTLNGPETPLEGGARGLLGASVPDYISVVQGCVLERMGDLIAQCVVWSIVESDTVPDSLEGVEGVQVVLREFKSLIGPKEKVRAALTADGESQYNKIFEAEQANLHAEPLVAAQVLGSALASCALHLSLKGVGAEVVSLWIRRAVLELSVDSLLLLGEGSDGESEWVGGCTYQKEVFAFLYGSLQSTLLMETQPYTHAILSSISDTESLKLFSLDRKDGNAALHLRVMDQGHPWVKETFFKLSQALCGR